MLVDYFPEIKALTVEDQLRLAAELIDLATDPLTEESHLPVEKLSNAKRVDSRKPTLIEHLLSETGSMDSEEELELERSG